MGCFLPSEPKICDRLVPLVQLSMSPSPQLNFSERGGNNSINEGKSSSNSTQLALVLLQNGKHIFEVRFFIVGKSF